VLDAEIQRILDLGVKTRLNCRIGTDISMDADPRRISMPFSWGWARKPAGHCPWKVRRRPIASPQPPS
jgi:hypothetical protein